MVFWGEEPLHFSCMVVRGRDDAARGAGLGQYISGAILYEETLFQNHANGTPFVKCLNDLGIIPGIKVDTGLEALPGADSIETWCTGLDGLLGRAQVCPDFFCVLLVVAFCHVPVDLTHFYFVHSSLCWPC